MTKFSARDCLGFGQNSCTSGELDSRRFNSLALSTSAQALRFNRNSCAFSQPLLSRPAAMPSIKRKIARLIGVGLAGVDSGAEIPPEDG
jgi:hypothetical protein